MLLFVEIYLVGFAALISIILAAAPKGYEDNTGFHYGTTSDNDHNNLKET